MMALQHEERPDWPYKSADERQKDDEVFLPAPIVKGQLVDVPLYTIKLHAEATSNIKHVQSYTQENRGEIYASTIPLAVYKVHELAPTNSP